jgi:hypothetical protein
MKADEKREKEASGRKHRLAVVIPVHWAAFMGGSQFQAKLLIEHLMEEGEYEVTYLAHRTQSGYESDSHSVKTTRGWQRLRRYTDLSESLSLYRALLALKPDLIYQRAASGFTGIAAFYAKHHGCPMVWHVASDMEVAPIEGDLRFRTLPKWLEKKAVEYGLRNASHIVVQTENQRRLLAVNYGRTDATVIRNFHQAPQSTEPKSERFRVTWVANLKPIKQPEVFLALASCLQDVPIDFSIVGGPSTNPRWQKEMDAQIAACPNVEYLGQLDQDAVNAELARSHLLVNTSKLEGFSNTFIQAWLRGVPVVSLNVDPDGLLNGELGYCAEGSLDRLVELVSDLASDRTRLDNLAQHVAEASRVTFSMRNATALTEVLRAALQSTPLRSRRRSDAEHQY